MATQFAAAASADCRNAVAFCIRPAGFTPNPQNEMQVTIRYQASTNVVIGTDINCDVVTGPPMPSDAAIRAETTKYAPVPHTSSGGVQYLVNPAIVFFAEGPAAAPDLSAVAVPRFSLSGHTFDVKLRLSSATWTWGDGTSVSYNGARPLGRPYSEQTPCESATACSGYVAHSFTRPGTYTVTVQAHWSGSYTVDGGSELLPIPGDIFRADPTGRTITVHEAHSVLVSPGPS